MAFQREPGSVETFLPPTLDWNSEAETLPGEPTARTVFRILRGACLLQHEDGLLAPLGACVVLTGAVWPKESSQGISPTYEGV